MLSSGHRLKKKTYFDRVFNCGTTFQNPLFGLGVYERGDNNPSLFGFVISTKISKKAVVRNKIKRRLSEAVKRYLKLIIKGYDIVFLVKHPIINKTAEQITVEVERTLKDASII